MKESQLQKKRDSDLFIAISPASKTVSGHADPQ